MYSTHTPSFYLRYEPGTRLSCKVKILGVSRDVHRGIECLFDTYTSHTSSPEDGADAQCNQKHDILTSATMRPFPPCLHELPHAQPDPLSSQLMIRQVQHLRGPEQTGVSFKTLLARGEDAYAQFYLPPTVAGSEIEDKPSARVIWFCMVD